MLFVTPEMLKTSKLYCHLQRMKDLWLWQHC